MRLFECIEPLKLPCCDKQGKAVAGREVTVPAGAAFIGEEDGDRVLLRGLPSTGYIRLVVSPQTLQAHFREMV